MTAPMNIVKKMIVSLVGMALLALEAEAAQAAVVTLNTSDSEFTPGVKNQGWWSSTTPNTDKNANYILYNWGFIYRNFFTFDVSSLPDEPILSATLELTRFGENTGADNPTEKLGLFDVSTDAATLNYNVGTNDAILEDLGTGQSYGTFEVSTTGTPTKVLSFSLNSAAIADIQKASNAGEKFFSIGGSLLNPNSPSVRRELFGNSGEGGVQRLRIVTSPVPEPPLILGSTVALCFGVFLKKQYSRK